MAKNGATKPWRSTCLQKCARCKHCSGDTERGKLPANSDRFSLVVNIGGKDAEAQNRSGILIIVGLSLMKSNR